VERCSKQKGKDQDDVMRRLGEGAEQKTLEEEIMTIRKNRKEKELRQKKAYVKIKKNTQIFNRIKRKQGKTLPHSFQAFHAKF